MYGPPPVMSPVPPPRGVGMARVALWVLVGVVLVGGVGLFAFIPLAVLAVRGRSARDALLAVASLAFSVLAVVVEPRQQDPAHEPVWFGLLACGMLAHGIAVTVWYVVCDLRHARSRALGGPAQAQAPVWAQGQPWAGMPPGGRPAPPAPRGRTAEWPTSAATAPAPTAAAPTGSATPTVAMPFAPLPEQPDRLGQVRAELDELSDYLRKEQGG